MKQNGHLRGLYMLYCLPKSHVSVRAQLKRPSSSTKLSKELSLTTQPRSTDLSYSAFHTPSLGLLMLWTCDGHSSLLRGQTPGSTCLGKNLPFPSYEILGKPLNFSKAQFPLTWAENSNFINLVGL